MPTSCGLFYTGFTAAGYRFTRRQGLHSQRTAENHTWGELMNANTIIEQYQYLCFGPIGLAALSPVGSRPDSMFMSQFRRIRAGRAATPDRLDGSQKPNRDSP
ncbi:unnamed protein product [Pieris macdunnoughi]|uniref:Uncharacterized protein n=1 Tax=Pieris macdunnoughi TaxID=345717 RepID=A0A821RBL8_9NEOP|nr:unnamed protein product [Pieris macdunnoughi]